MAELDIRYFDYLTVDPVFNFARFIKDEKMKIMNSRGGAITPVATPTGHWHWRDSAPK